MQGRLGWPPLTSPGDRVTHVLKKNLPTYMLECLSIYLASAKHRPSRAVTTRFPPRAPLSGSHYPVPARRRYADILSVACVHTLDR